MDIDTDSAAPSGPLPIRKLEESLINKIAAGEIIHRPASALKELIENSLDAGSTNIRVTVKDGGMKLLQIQDNGCGIRKSDLPILAQRFTTSKLRTFSDLSKLTTYGFRGEALSSVSHVAHLSVVTKTKADSCAWKAIYQDGVLIPVKAGQSADPKPVAGTEGTIITVEDLFYNSKTRLVALRSSSEEYTRILDVITKYAVHNPHVSFMCKKAGNASADISTPGGEATSKQVIKLMYGSTVAKELMEVSRKSAVDVDADVDMDDPDDLPDTPDKVQWEFEGLVSNSSYQSKKTTFLLFINHRLVDAPRLKKALEGVYAPVLPKGSSPFLYISLEIDPRSIDVNVHPTKREVHFLHEDEIIERLAGKVSEAVGKVSSSRVFEYQTLLSGTASLVDDSRGKYRKDDATSSGSVQQKGESSNAASISSTSALQTQKKVYSQHKIRQSDTERTLDSMIPLTQASRISSDPAMAVNEEDAASEKTRFKEITESVCYLTSVMNLRKELVAGKHSRLTEIIQKHIFVGIVDLDKCLSLVQHEAKLYLVNHESLAQELFYQLALRQFGDFRRVKLDPPPKISEIIRLAVGVESDIEKLKVSVDDVAEKITGVLISRRDMLQEYFGMSITEDGMLTHLPVILREYTPNIDKLPLFLMRLGPQVNWTSEKECFATFLRELAYFHVPGPILPVESPTKDADGEGSSSVIGEHELKTERWQIQHVLFPALKKYFVAPKDLLDRDVVQIANLPDLYRVFERC